MSHIVRLILDCFVIIGPLKPEVEEKAAELQFCSSLVHLSPPLFSPQEPHAVRRATHLSAESPLFFRSFFGSFLDIDFWSIWGRFGAPSWGHFRHFWRPSWAKFGPKRVLEAYQHQKREFSPNTTPANTGAIFGTPRWPPKCPKIGPRRLQDALEEQLFGS